MHGHTSELTLALAFVLGALHALEPGHGKTAMLAYFIDGKRSRWQPLVLGLATAVSHSISLFSLALIVHLTYHVATGDHHHERWIAGLLQVISAALILLIGVYLLIQAVRGNGHRCCAGRPGNDNTATESLVQAANKQSRCGCGSRFDANAKETPGFSTYKTTAVLGVAVGLLPCPSALAAFFSGLSSGFPLAAYAIVAVFSCGIACSLMAAGLLMQHFGERVRNQAGYLSRLPWAYLRACLILGVGMFYLVGVVGG
jgi:nickel/cobalt transporter (NicO) family protein